VYGRMFNMSNSFGRAGGKKSPKESLRSAVENFARMCVRRGHGQFRWLGAAVAAGAVVTLIGGAHGPRGGATHAPMNIIIDYPLNASVFPPDMEPPRFEWRDPAQGVREWRIEIHFSDGAASLRTVSKGEGVKLGEIDPRCVSGNNKPPTLSDAEESAHTWKPEGAMWAAIRKDAASGPATITISGFASGNEDRELSHGSMRLTLSHDPVGAPIFYRDVPLMPSAGSKGLIQPLDKSAVPLIAWRMRNLAEPSSHIVMTGLHSCANCHSFSRDGKTLGLDMDGPQNDKGLYALVPVAQQMTVRTQDMISWAKFSGEANPQLRVGFMSQVSPDGRYVMTTIKPPGTKNWQFYYVTNFTDYRFLQVFYPTRGILAWYDRETKQLKPLPGADDPKFVQASAVWSPDGKYLVFARAEAKDPSPPGGKMAQYANDPAEVQIQYDLYRIPFNGGQGGTPEPIQGASNNGMSNSFPKVSPDGKWIVFVEARNGQLMRPDGKLYIVPASGGKARLMNCNTPLMNSWHSFSPNGRWMVYSSKSRSPYTQLFLTHIDEDGNDTPALRIENSTAANRAVNIPEFVNMNPSGIEHIDTPAVDFYKQYDLAADLSNKGDYAAAIPEWQKVLTMEPDDVRSHFVYGETLLRVNRLDDGIAELRVATRLNPEFAEAHNNLGVALGRAGRHDESLQEFHQALRINPGYAEAHNNLGLALLEQGRNEDAENEFRSSLRIDPKQTDVSINLGDAFIAEGKSDQATAEFRGLIATDPQNAAAHNGLGLAMVAQGDLGGAAEEFGRAVELAPGNADLEASLGHALMDEKKYMDAIPHLKKAVELSPDSAENHASLGLALAKDGQPSEAVPQFQRAVALAPDSVEDRYYLGKALILSGRGADGLDQWKQALARAPDHLQLLNDTSWVLSTSSDGALRNGPEAVRLATHAVDLTQGNEPALLGTLAAANAEIGQFDKAIELEQRAADLAAQKGQADLAKSLLERLAVFKSKTPIRQ
jgi:tetratricopeptide (TPR) repeat protein